MDTWLPFESSGAHRVPARSVFLQAACNASAAQQTRTPIDLEVSLFETDAWHCELFFKREPFIGSLLATGKRAKAVRRIRPIVLVFQ